MENLFDGIYKNKTVLITGHSGFKGSWLAFWLKNMGAKVVGYSLEAPTNPNHIGLLKLDIDCVNGDIGDFDKLDQTFKKFQPDIVFHLAAQPLVRLSYENPILTYETNVMGTLKVFEACKKNGTKAIVNITSDKAYENKEWIWGYREGDRLGGYDPYSSSKGCAEILTSSYRNSYFNPKQYKKTHDTLLASCRAGNVIGGGDWAKDRLLSDIMINAGYGQGGQGSKECAQECQNSQSKTTTIRTTTIRNPKATRPWQHVLEPLSGYLTIGQKLLEQRVEFSDAWNFGASSECAICVEEVVKKSKKYWDKIEYEIIINDSNPHEANFLKLDCSKAYGLLRWKSVWDIDTTLEKTVSWYKEYYENGLILTQKNLEDYVKDAKSEKIQWAMAH